jgi:hypothetical protein
MFRARAGARRTWSDHKPARLYRLCRRARGEIASATGDIAPAAAGFAERGRVASRRVVKLAKQRENSVSLRDTCPGAARARARPHRPAPAVGCIRGRTDVTQIIAETAHLLHAFGPAALRGAGVLRRPVGRRTRRLRGGRGLGLCDGGRVRPRWHGRHDCRSVCLVGMWRRPLLAGAIAGRPHLRTARLRWRLGKAHCGRGRLRNEHERTDAHNHSDGENADNATRKL